MELVTNRDGTDDFVINLLDTITCGHRQCVHAVFPIALFFSTHDVQKEVYGLYTRLLHQQHSDAAVRESLTYGHIPVEDKELIDVRNFLL